MSVNPTDRAIALFSTIPEAPFKVVNPKNRRVIALIGKEDIFIMDKGKKGHIYALGINIPPFLREKFENKLVVSHGDPSFYKAFITAECWNLLRGGYRIEKEYMCPCPLSLGNKI